MIYVGVVVTGLSALWFTLGLLTLGTAASLAEILVIVEGYWLSRRRATAPAWS